MSRRTVTDALSENDRSGTSKAPPPSPDRVSKVGLPADMRALQRAVGNRIVSSLMQPDTQPPPDANGTASAPPSSGSSGSPLDAAVRSSMEARFGQDLSSVRIHSGKDAQRRAMAEDAAAFTTGTDIYFAPGRYKPGDKEGQRLIAHELAHVLQQVGGERDLRTSSPSNLEHEAESLATRDAGPAGHAVQGGTRFGTLQTDAGGETDLHFRGQRGEKGIGVFYVKNWKSLSKTERANILAWCKEVDFYYSRGVARVKPSRSARAEGRTAAALARLPRALNLPKGVHAGHTPDKSGGGHPLGPLQGLPGKFNMSIGGQLQRYKRGFVFTGFSLYDHDTGKWLYHSLALEHEPPATTPGPPKRPRQSGKKRRATRSKRAGRQTKQQPPPAQPKPAPAARQRTSKRSKDKDASARAKHDRSRQTQQSPARRAKQDRKATPQSAGSAKKAPPPNPPVTPIQSEQGETQQPPRAGAKQAAVNAKPPAPPSAKGASSKAGLSGKSGTKSLTAPKVPAAKIDPPDASIAPHPPAQPKVTIDPPEAPPLKVNTKAVLRKAPKIAGGALKGQMVGTLKGAAAGMAIDLVTSWIKSKGAQLQIERGIQEQLKALEPRFEELLAASPKQIHAKVRVTMWTVTTEKLTQQGVEEREGFPNVLVSVALVTEPVEAVTETPAPEQYWGGSIQWSYATYSFLLLDVEKERRRQEVAREEEKLRERMRRLAELEKKRTSRKKKKSGKESQLPPPGSATGWFTPAPEPAPLLPGPGGAPPAHSEAEYLQEARRVSRQLLAEARTMAREGATPAQKSDFQLRVQVWSGLVEKMMRDFSDQDVVGKLRNLFYAFKERLDNIS